MKPPGDEERWEKRFRAAPELLFTEELKERILAAARAESSQRPLRHTARRVPRRHLRGWLAAFAGVAAAAVMVAAVWGTGAKPGPPEGETAAVADGQAASHHVAGPVQQSPLMAPVPTGGGIRLKLAPLAVTNVKTVASTPGGPRDTVEATLVNTGTTTLQKQDVWGVLSFAPAAPGHGGIDWVTAVDGPDAPLAPGQSVTWSFRPATQSVPKDAKGNLVDAPRLAFYQSGMLNTGESGPSGDAVMWSTADVRASVTGLTVSATWSTGEAFVVHAEVTNNSDRPLDWSGVFAVIWFTDPKQPGVAFTAPDVPRFFTLVKGPLTAPDQLLPGETASLSLPLVGGPAANLPNLSAHVLLVDHSGAAP
ncbi:MAG: hypothetical protein K6T78_01320 [Alicyclobacillus sp.]|nr:hypothetical protein [Alicyclobacillus sp.]